MTGAPSSDISLADVGSVETVPSVSPPASCNAARALARRRRPCVVVLGEFGSGKSSLINAVLGAAAIPTGPGASVPLPILVSYAPKPSLAAELECRRRIPADWASAGDASATPDARRMRVGLPLDLLRSLRLVDAPGFGTGEDAVDDRARDACRRASAAVWCTPAMQAWKASERGVWLGLPKRFRRKSILAVTFKDAIASVVDIHRLRDRLQSQAAPYFSAVIMISTVDALRARPSANGAIDAELWHQSGGAALMAALKGIAAR